MAAAAAAPPSGPAGPAAGLDGTLFCLLCRGSRCVSNTLEERSVIFFVCVCVVVVFFFSTFLPATFTSAEEGQKKSITIIT